MKRRHHVTVLITALVLLLAMTVPASAVNYTLDSGTCTFDGEEMTSDFGTEDLVQAMENMEPGDSLKFTVTYTNDSDFTTEWYMLNKVIQTLEESKSVAENGGYTYVLKNIGPDGSKTTLFDNSSVGGDTVIADLEGLKQATNATQKYFHIQQLEPGESGQTYLKVAFDGETEVNDYMDTAGGLLLSYAVEKTKVSESKDSDSTKESHPVTGDPMNLMKYIIIMTAALIIGLLAFFSWRKERKDGEES